MELSTLSDSVGNLAEILTLVVPYAVLLAGVFGLGTLVVFSFIRQH